MNTREKRQVEAVIQEEIAAILLDSTGDFAEDDDLRSSLMDAFYDAMEDAIKNIPPKAVADKFTKKHRGKATVSKEDLAKIKSALKKLSGLLVEQDRLMSQFNEIMEDKFGQSRRSRKSRRRFKNFKK